MTRTIAVIGAGLQGCCVALALARRGARVVLYDREAEPLTRASRWNEGKIHLGYIYANDHGDGTPERMLDGAFSFASLLHRLTGIAAAGLGRSDPFHYLVLKDSLLPAERIAAHFARVDAAITERSGADYLGGGHPGPSARLSPSDWPEGYDPDRIAAVFRTPEIAIHPGRLCRAVRDAVASTASIEFVGERRVAALDPDGPNGPRIHFGDGQTDGPFDQIVNCAWEDRLRLDASAGHPPPKPFLIRHKFAIHMRGERPRGGPPSSTLMLGKFGDIVRFEDGWYLSWYPACRSLSSHALEPPALPGAPDCGEDGLRDEVMDALAGIIPGIRDIDPETMTTRVEGGFIVSWGGGGIDDLTSEVHSRADIGVTSHGALHSVNTGKLGMAPFFAEDVARRVFEV